MSYHRHFAPDYFSARDAFRAAAVGARAVCEGFPHPKLGREGEVLATETAWLGPTDAQRVLLVVSGTHGVEGLYGSGVQVGWLRDGGATRLPDGVAVLLVHAINPWGFSWLRRTDHENHDINRNFLDFDRPPPDNPGYRELAPLFEPQSWDDGSAAAIRAALSAYAKQHGKRALAAAISAGQHSHPGGMFYGGTAPCWSHRTMRAISERFLGRAREICVLDLHTGLGPFGHSEIICRHPPGSAELASARAWFGKDVTSPAAGESDSPVIEGNLRMAIGRFCPQARVVAQAIEVGTLPSAEVEQALVADNWLWLRGDPLSAQGAAIRTQVRDAFYPDRDDWRDKAYPRAQQIVADALAGLASL